MKFLAAIRAQYATFYALYLSEFYYKYLNLNTQQKHMIKSAAAVISVCLIYFLIHFGYLCIFGHPRLVPSPMVIRHGNDIEIPKGSPLRAQIELKTVELSAAPHVLSLPGWVEAIPSKNVSIFPPLTGRLTSLSVGVGDHVRAGQVLATLRSPDFAQANSDYQKALSTYVLAEAILKRAKSVNQVGGNTVQAVQQAKNDVLQAESELKRTQARLKAFAYRASLTKQKSTPLSASTSDEVSIFRDAEMSLDDAHLGIITLRSSVNGRVTSINYGIGSYINDLTAPLMRVVDLRKVWVTANVAENMLSNIHKGQSVSVTFLAYPNKPYQGYISFVHPELDPATRRNQTRVVLSNLDGKLQPNMYANVEVRVEESPQMKIPLSSVLMNNESTVVYVESSPWVCQRREIELGAEDGESVRVLSGLRPGERIVTCGGVFINDK